MDKAFRVNTGCTDGTCAKWLPHTNVTAAIACEDVRRGAIEEGRYYGPEVTGSTSGHSRISPYMLMPEVIHGLVTGFGQAFTIHPDRYGGFIFADGEEVIGWISPSGGDERGDNEWVSYYAIPG